MAAHSAGRIAAALGGGPPPSAAAVSDDFLSGESGTVGGKRDVLRELGDLTLDALALPARIALARAARRSPPRRRVLALSIVRVENAATYGAALRELRRTRHELVTSSSDAGARGRFENLNRLLGEHSLDEFDWLLVLDDDVILPRGFLDGLINLAERYELRLAQPAHRLRSHAAWRVTRRRARSVVRETAFVEIGPVTALHRDTFGQLLPFPALRMGWGLDAHWSALARMRGWRVALSTSCRSRTARRPLPASIRAKRRSPRRAPSSPSAPIPRPASYSGRSPYIVDARSGRRRVLPAQRRSGPRHLGSPAGAGGARRRRRDQRLRARAHRGPARRKAAPGATRRCAADRRARCSLRPLPLTTPPVELCPVGGARGAGARSCAAQGRVVRPDPCAQCGSGRRRRATRRDGRSRRRLGSRRRRLLDGLARAAGRAHRGTHPRGRAHRPRQQRGGRAAGADAWRTRHARRPSRHGPTVSRRAQPAAAHRDRRASRRAQTSLGSHASDCRDPDVRF